MDSTIHTAMWSSSSRLHVNLIQARMYIDSYIFIQILDLILIFNSLFYWHKININLRQHARRTSMFPVRKMILEGHTSSVSQNIYCGKNRYSLNNICRSSKQNKFSTWYVVQSDFHIFSHFKCKSLKKREDKTNFTIRFIYKW